MEWGSQEGRQELVRVGPGGSPSEGKRLGGVAAALILGQAG